MINFWTLLQQKTDLVWLLVALTFYMHMPYFQAAQYVDNTETRFRQFVVEYNRTYARNSSEYAKRLAIFEVSLTGFVSKQK